MIRKVLKIQAEDSPNVRLFVAEMRAGLREPDPFFVREEAKPWGLYDAAEYQALLVKWGSKGCPEPEERTLVPGVLTWSEYRQRRMIWDKPRQVVGLDAEFYEGAENLMFPPHWLDACEREWERLERGKVKRQAKSIGVDSGEGRAETVWVVGDELGVMKLKASKTRDTSVITGDTLGLMREFDVEPEDVMLDAGGGGIQHADRMRAQGFPVRTVGFGESMILAPKRGLRFFSERVQVREERTVFKNRRAQMFWTLRMLVDPTQNEHPYAFKDDELRRQLASIPILYDEEGKLFLPPKQRKAGAVLTKGNPNRVKSMEELIGCSPDRADALVVQVHAMLYEAPVTMAGAVA